MKMQHHLPNDSNGNPVFSILGPLVVRTSAGSIPVTAVRQRMVLGILLSRANQVVALDSLAEALWGGGAVEPRNATIYSHVRHLRRTLGPELAPRLGTYSGGYVLHVNPGELDADLFTVRQEAGGRAMNRGDWCAAVRDLDSALSLWRDVPYADVPVDVLQLEESEYLQEQWLTVVEWRNRALLQAGQWSAVILPLRRLVQQYPLREAFAEQLMWHWLRPGAGDALATYERVCDRLWAELEQQPGALLQERCAQVLPDRRASVRETAPPLNGRRPRVVSTPVQPQQWP